MRNSDYEGDVVPSALLASFPLMHTTLNYLCYC